MTKLTCGECYKQFNGNENIEGDYWICPHCHAVLEEGET